MQDMQNWGEYSTHSVQDSLGKPIAPLWEEELKRRISVKLNLYLESLGLIKSSYESAAHGSAVGLDRLI